MTNHGSSIPESAINSKNSPPLFLVVILPPLRKLRSIPAADYSAYITSSVDVIGGQGQSQLGGYSGLFGQMLRQSLWLPIAPDAVATLLPASPFSVLLPEQIFIDIDHRLLEEGCAGFVEASFLVEADTSSGAVAVAKVATAITNTPVTTTVFAIGTSVSSDAQSLVLVGLMACATSSDARQRSTMRFIVSPFYDSGSLAVITGNLGIALVIAFVQLVAAFVVYRRSSIENFTFLDGCRVVRFPRLAYSFACFLFNGIALASSILVQEITGENTGLGFVGAVGIVLCCLFIYSNRIVTDRYARISYVTYDDETLQARFGNKVPRFFVPRGYWTPPEELRLYGSYFGHMTQQFYRFGSYNLVQTFVVAIISSISPPKSDCFIQYFFLAFWFYLWMGGLIYFKPLRCNLIMAVQLTTNFVLGTMMLLNGVNYLRPDPQIVAASAILSLLQVICVIMNLFYLSALAYAENRRRATTTTTTTTSLDGVSLEDGLTADTASIANGKSAVGSSAAKKLGFFEAIFGNSFQPIRRQPQHKIDAALEGIMIDSGDVPIDEKAVELLSLGFRSPVDDTDISATLPNLPLKNSTNDFLLYDDADDCDDDDDDDDDDDQNQPTAISDIIRGGAYGDEEMVGLSLVRIPTSTKLHSRRPRIFTGRAPSASQRELPPEDASALTWGSLLDDGLDDDIVTRHRRAAREQQERQLALAHNFSNHFPAAATSSPPTSSPQNMGVRSTFRVSAPAQQMKKNGGSVNSKAQTSSSSGSSAQRSSSSDSDISL